MYSCTEDTLAFSVLIFPFPSPRGISLVTPCLKRRDKRCKCMAVCAYLTSVFLKKLLSASSYTPAYSVCKKHYPCILRSSEWSIYVLYRNCNVWRLWQRTLLYCACSRSAKSQNLQPICGVRCVSDAAGSVCVCVCLPGCHTDQLQKGREKS